MKNLFKKILWPIIAMMLSFSAAAHAYTTTTNYSFKLPQVNNAIDQDQWGTYLNSNISSLDSLLKTASNDVTAALSADTTIDSTYQNKVILGDATSASFTVNLQAAATAGSGFKVIVKKIDSTAHTVTVKGNSSELIDAANTYVISTQYNAVQIVSDGTKWWVVPIQPIPSSIVKSIHTQVFTSGGTYTPTSGMIYAVVREVGGGASGGGTASHGQGATNGAGGGGGGEYAESVLTAAQVGASQAVTIGAGGAAPSSGANNGNVGGDTSLGSLVIAKGGAGGTGAAASASGPGGAGGTGGTGSILIDGQSGGAGTGAVGSSFTPYGGGGGSSLLGFGATPTTGAEFGAINGNNGQNYGGGGSGSAATSTSGTGAGGAGAGGEVIITEYCSQ